MKDILIKGNRKMGKDVYLYNLPAQKTCTPTKWCLEGRCGKPRCYALRNNFRLSSAIKAAEARLEFSKREDFVEKMIKAIERAKVKYFRFHSGGDFYSTEYVQKVYEVVLACQNTLFRTTTRRRDLSSSVLELNSLPNMIIRESLDPFRPYPEMGLPFTALDDMDVAKEGSVFFCQNDCPTCGYYCWYCDDNISFKEF